MRKNYWCYQKVCTLAEMKGLCEELVGNKVWQFPEEKVTIVPFGNLYVLSFKVGKNTRGRKIDNLFSNGFVRFEVA